MARLLSLGLLIIELYGTLVASYPYATIGGYPGFSPALLQTSTSLPAGTMILVPNTLTRGLPVDPSVINAIPVAAPTTGVLPTGTNNLCCSSGLSGAGLPLGQLGGLGGNLSLLNIILSLLLSGVNPLGLLGGGLPLQNLGGLGGGCGCNVPFACNLPALNSIPSLPCSAGLPNQIPSQLPTGALPVPPASSVPVAGAVPASVPSVPAAVPANAPSVPAAVPAAVPADVPAVPAAVPATVPDVTTLLRTSAQLL